MFASEVASPYSINEATAFLRRFPLAIPAAACTRLLIDPAFSKRPITILSLSNIKELQAVSRTDRFLDIGACVSITRIINLPNISSLEPLKKTLLTIGSASIRNRASLGGNICSPDSFGSAFPMLSCMEASVELRSGNQSRWLRIHELVSEAGRPALPKGSFLTRLRLPIRDWDFSCIVRKGNSILPGEHGSSFAALANIEKNAISELRIAVAGAIQVRSRDLEMNLNGKKLPLAAKDIENSRHQFLETAIEAGLAPSIAISSADTVRAFLQNLSGDSA